MEVKDYENCFEKGTIIDGVIDENEYFKSKYRIAWFLKEAYSDEEQGFHIRKYYGQPDAYNDFFKNVATTTWHPIIYSSYGILNNFVKWNEIPFIRNKPDMCDLVKNIAIINANKFPSLTGVYTLYKNLEYGFNHFKKLIEMQIEVLQPQIHIFCGTFYLYKDLFMLTENHLISDNTDDYWIHEKDGKLFLEVYHPAQTKLTRESYVNRIIEAVENWSKRNSK